MARDERPVTAARGSTPDARPSRDPHRDVRIAAFGAALIVALACLTTLQWTYNSSSHVYTTDVGEIQNALPRWGTLHFTGYPVYSILGSVFVSLLRLVGVGPALGASLYSAVWSLAAAALVAALAVRLGARCAPAVLGAVAYGLSTSAWMNGSIAEVHSLTMAFTSACLLLAVRYDATGARRDLVWLAVAFVHGVLHMRAVLFLAPALALLVAPRAREIARAWRPLVAVAVLSPLVYLYMPLREWMGATWTFGQTRTWRGFWAMVLDTKVDRIVRPPADAAEWWQRARTVVGLLNDDLWWPLLVLGLVGVFALAALARASRPNPWRSSAALTLAWLPYAALCLVIWEGKVSDALLAVKLPVPMIAGVGLALGLTWIGVRLGDGVGRVAIAVAALGVAGVAVRSGRTIAPIVRDASLSPLVADADRLSIGTRAERPPVTLIALWGHSFWALSYAQAFQQRIAGLTLVDHNADVGTIARREMLLTPGATVTVLPVEWWRERLGDVHPEMIAPGIVWLRGTSRAADDGRIAGLEQGLGWSVRLSDGFPSADQPDASRGPFIVNDAIAIAAADVRCPADEPATLVVTVDWVATRVPRRAESVAVHILAGPDDRVVAQADRAVPIDGWRPTTGWAVGERVRDMIAVQADDAARAAVRVTAYHGDGAGGFVNGAWLRLPLPDDCQLPITGATRDGSSLPTLLTARPTG